MFTLCVVLALNYISQDILSTFSESTRLMLFTAGLVRRADIFA